MMHGADAELAPVRDLVLAGVRIRFAVTMEAFVAHVLSLVRVGSDPELAPKARVARLNLDDLYLAVACAAGEDDAWAEFIARYRDFIHRFARRVLTEPGATDLADEVIVDLWQRRKLARYEGRSSLKTWLGAVVSHAAINAAKTRKMQEPSTATDVAARLDPEREIGDTERSTALARVLAESIARQPVQDRLLVLLYYEQGLTLDQIEPVMGLSKAALSRRLKRIRHAVLNDANALALRRIGTSARSLADGLELSRVDLDFRAACRLTSQRDPIDSV